MITGVIEKRASQEKYSVSILYLKPPLNVVITGSDEGCIYVYDGETLDQIHFNSEVDGRISDLCAWNQNTILSSSWSSGNYVKSISFTKLSGSKMTSQSEKTIELPYSPFKLAKLREGFFACTTDQSVFILDYERAKVHQELENHGCSWYSLPIVSEKHKESFYFESRSEDISSPNYSNSRKIRRFDFKDSKIGNEYVPNKEVIEVAGMLDPLFVVFTNKKMNQEIVLCFTMGSVVSGGYEEKKRHILLFQSHLPPSENLMKRIELSWGGSLYSLLNLRDRYVLLGSGTGFLAIFDLEKLPESFQSVHNVKLNSASASESVFATSVMEVRNREVRLVSSLRSSKNSVVKYMLKGVDIQIVDAMEVQDLRERIDFLGSFFEGKKEFGIQIRVGNTNFSVLRILML